MIQSSSQRQILFQAFVLLVIANVTAAPASAINVLLIKKSGGALTSEEQARKSQFEAWGHTVTTLQDSSSQSQYDTALASAHVVYLSEEVNSSDAGYKVRSATIGVLSEVKDYDDQIGFSTTDGSEENSTNLIDVTNNSHEITTGIGTGYQAIFNSTQPRILMQGTTAGGFQSLARSASANHVLGVIETGAALANTYNGNNTASGPRVRLPWGGGSFSFSSLNANGLSILQNALDWAGSTGGDAPELVAHWKLDETSGSTADDDTGNGHTGSVVGSINWVNGIRDNGFQFDGATSIDVSGVFSEPQNVSLVAWAKLMSADTSGAEIISLGDRIGLRFSASGEAVAYYHDGASTVELVFNQPFAGDGWHHFVMVFDDDQNSVKLYVDGVEAASGAAANSISYNGGNTRLGRQATGGATYDFSGTLDDVRVYNYALTVSEIQDIFGLLGHWYLDEPSGPTAADSSPAGNDGTYKQGVNRGQPGPLPGTLAAEFDGQNDHVTIPNESHFDVTETVTIAAWIKVDQFDIEWQAIVAKGDSAWRLSRNGFTNTIHFAINSGYTQEVVNSVTEVNDGQWHHVAAVYDGSNMRLYIDGELDATTATTRAIATNNYDVYLGENTEYTGRHWDGCLYDVRLYNRPLGQEEIDQLSGSSLNGVRIIKWIEIK